MLDKRRITESAVASFITTPMIIVLWELFIRGWVL